MSPLSGNYWGVTGFIVFWVLLAVALSLFARRLYFLYRSIRLGKPENRADKLVARAAHVLSVNITQSCTLKSVTRKDLSGIGHAMMFWGFGLFVIGYVIFTGLGAGFGLSSLFIGSTFERVYLSIMDIAALLFVVAVVMAVIKRYIIKPERLERHESAKEKIIQASLFSVMIILMLLFFSMEGFRYAAYNNAGTWPLVASAIARLIISTGIAQSTLLTTFMTLWWINYGLLLVVVVYIPNSKHLHPLFSPANILFKERGPKMSLLPIPLEGEETFGASKIQDFTWKQLLDMCACTWCGRCQDNCPAHNSGKTLSPREVILKLKEHLLETSPELLKGKTETTTEKPVKAMIGDVITEEEIWACTTCGACQEVCPVNIEHVRKIIDMRRNLVLTQNKMPESAQLMLRNMQSRGNPWAGIQSMRLRGDWTNGLDVKILADGQNTDTLFWVGCTGALAERNVKSTLAMTRVLKAAGIDFGVLGDAEACCGDPARRAGYEFQFQIMAEQNIEQFKSHNIKRIITYCPHCYNTLKNEYPKYGGNFEVIHYTQLIADLMKQGKLKLTKELDAKLTYHDPCYLGRYNDVYQEPREILQSIPKAKLKEMERSRNKSFCCGGGGGLMWIEEQPGTTKISHVRLEDVLKTGADTVVTACPYCLQMFEESIEHKGIQDKLKARDLIEIVEEAMK